MTNYDEDFSKKGTPPSHGNGDKTPGKDQRQEPTFGRYDEDDNYEEPDRDSDYTSGYHAEDVDDDEEYEDDFSEDDERDLFEDEDPEDDPEPHDEEEPEAWLDEDDYSDKGDDSGQNWPFGLIAVAIVAVVLLAAGGYGVMQQRAAAEAELRELRAALSTASSPTDVSADRETLAELQTAYDALAKELENLRLENRTLADTVTGLEGQLGGQQVTPTKASPAPVEAAATAKANSATKQPAQAVTSKSAAPATTVAKPAAVKPAEPKSAVAVASGPWFVNFGSYATRNMAESWATRLHPGTGKVIILPVSSDGKTLYRLRVIGLADREVAKGVARKLETELGVAQLWIGKE